MKATVEWLKEFVETEAECDEVGATLTMLGIELEGIEDSALGPVLDIKVTPNRGDCLSVLGLARELCAKDCNRYKPTPLMLECVKGWMRGDKSETPESASVEILEPDLCPRYGARIWKGIKPCASSEWIQKRLLACGMRPISVVVDTTNYVMLELGQPLHAFDYSRLAEGRIVVRCAEPGERITTLDGTERKLREDMLMICDAGRPVAIAGVMGGEATEVGDGTTSLLLESAHFDPVSIRRTRRALALNTDASYRFERYVDPEGVIRALNRFAELLKEQTGADCLPGVIDVYPKPPRAGKIRVRKRRWNMLLGMEVPAEAAATSLQALGCRVAEVDGALDVAPPSWRADLGIEDDLVEEIGRVWGYEKIPEKLPAGTTTQGGESPQTAFRSRIRECMIRLGFAETVAHSLRDRSPLDPECERIEVRNPTAPETALLRCSILPGLAETAAKNRGMPVFIFEVGRVFQDNDESISVGFLMSGPLSPDHWTGDGAPIADYFAAKGVVNELFAAVSRKAEFQESDDSRFHPARQASVYLGGKRIGLFGEISVEAAEKLDVPIKAVIGEMNIDAMRLAPEEPKIYRPISPYPAVKRDLAMAVGKDVPYGQLEQAVRDAAGELLESIRLFDVYEDDSLGDGFHGIAISVVLRHSNRTLTDEEANEVRERAFEALKALGATRR